MTIDIAEDVYRDAMARAALTSRTVSQVIEDAVRESLLAKPNPARGVADLPTYGGSGPLPGVDLGHSGSLYDVMDG